MSNPNPAGSDGARRRKRKAPSLAGAIPAALVLAFGLCACGPPGEGTGPGSARSKSPATVASGVSLPLFDGKTLEGWKVTSEDDFTSHGEVSVKEGYVVLGKGSPYTGISWTGDFPGEDYEVAVEAKRLSGRDIFCGLTVPVGESHVTLVLGGWGDCLVGLSNVDHWNASENETTRAMGFENDRWYSVSLRVSAARIEAWIDGERVVDQEREGRTFTIYDQLHPQRPFGFFSWGTTAALRKIEMKRLGRD